MHRSNRGGDERIRTAVQGFADPCLTPRPRRLIVLPARPAGLEPATCGLEVRCSIQLSYGRSSTAIRRLTLH